MPRPPINAYLDEVRHSGALTVSSLFESFPRSLFRPSSYLEEDDPFHMGWEYVPSRSGYKFILDDLWFATAEGAVTLAALLDWLRINQNEKISLEIGPNAAMWGNALQLTQSTNRWSKGLPKNYAKLAAAWYVFPLWRMVLDSKQSCIQVAGQVAEQVRKVLIAERLSEEHQANEISNAVDLVMREALLNVFQHAYDAGQENVVIGAVTLTPAPERNAKGVDYSTQGEKDWFHNLQGEGLMLEVAIVDYGRNVPSTLWNAFRKHFPNAFNRIKKSSLGSAQGIEERANLHNDIALWAFNHQSTSKSSSDFPNKIARHNWRGLHRAVNIIARYDGCIVMRSGVTRSGYAFKLETVVTLKPTDQRKHQDFPGTSFVLRIPIFSDRNRRKRARSSLREDITARPIDLKRVLNIDDAIAQFPSEFGGKATVVGVTHPFATYQQADLEILLDKIKNIPPHVIVIHLFVDFASKTILDEMRAFDDDNQLHHWGPPRLAAWWKPGEPLSWKFIGIIPTSALSIVDELETKGVATIGRDDHQIAFAREIAGIYSPFIAIENESLYLKCFDSLPLNDLDSANQAFGSAFGIWDKTTLDKPWIFDFEKNNKYVLLATGRVVKRYFSILKLLYQNDLLTNSLGWLMAAYIQEFDEKNICLVTESLAGYSIANKLLEGKSDIPIVIGSPDRYGLRSRPTIIFADAIFKAQTLHDLLRKNPKCKRVICCLHLQKNDDEPVVDDGVIITSLLPYHFDPDEQKNRGCLTDDNTLEVDAATHIPSERIPIDDLRLGVSEGRNEFIMANPQLFRYGWQLGGRRVHVATLSTQRYLTEHLDTWLDWIQQEIKDALADSVGSDLPIDIIFFTRNEANVTEVVNELGRRLLTSTKLVSRTFSVSLPIVPTGPREVFGRLTPDLDLLEGIRPVGTTRLFFDEAPSKFVAVYLDDSCVTGKTLLNLIRRASIAKSLPSAIIAIPILSRLSPAEEHLYRHIFKDVNVPDQKGKRVPFVFRPLFRLQVGSFEMLEATPVFHTTSKIVKGNSFFSSELEEYVKNIKEAQENIDYRDFSERNNPVLQHPFYDGPPTAEETISSRVLFIRHLIALQEQNVGVLSYLIEEIVSACEQEDYSLLMMLAIEPSLLGSAPIRSELRRNITQLALKALESKSANDGIKSDALCVISLQDNQMQKNLGQVFPLIASAPHLINELLAFILTAVPRNPTLLDDLLDTIENHDSPRTKKLNRDIRVCINTYRYLAEPKRIVDLSSARRAIRRLVVRTSYHAKSLEIVLKINNRLLAKDSTGSEMKSIIKEWMDLAETDLLEGIEGLAFCAEVQEYHIARRELEITRKELIAALGRLRIYADALPTEEIPIEIKGQINSAWNDIRKHSFDLPANKLLSVPTNLGSHPSYSDTKGGSPVEHWMPEFFSLPREIALELSAIRSNLGVSISFPDEVIIVPVAVRHVWRIFDLLLGDMEQHGKPGTSEIAFLTEKLDGQILLIAKFTNEILSSDRRGSGMSQKEINAILETPDLGISITFPDDKSKVTGKYRVRITFSDAIQTKLVSGE